MYIFQISSRAYIEFIKEFSSNLPWNLGFIEGDSNRLNVKYSLMTPLLQWGTHGEICYLVTKNLTDIEEYMSLENNSSIRLDTFNWTMLVVRWNNISKDPLAESISKVFTTINHNDNFTDTNFETEINIILYSSWYAITRTVSTS